MRWSVPSRRLLREPLVQFIVAGVVLYVAYVLVRGPGAAPLDDRTIVVDRRALLTYLQYQANAFEPGAFGAALDSLSPSELEQLVDAYVLEEIRYREAQSLGLMSSDYIIRQRMIQKIDFLLGDIAAVGLEADDAQLRQYFDVHKDAYAIEPSLTFTHVFFDSARRGHDQARADAVALLHLLNESGSGFNDATGYGDRFPFSRNYVDRTSSYVASQFGNEFAAAIDALPRASIWQGPIRSAYGEHIVMITRHTERSYPELEQVREIVERDFVEERTAESRAQMLERLRKRYRVEVVDIGIGR